MKLLMAIQDIPIGPEKEESLMANLILSYLGYHAYKKAAKALACSIASPKLASGPILLHLMQSMDQRQSRSSIMLAYSYRLIPWPSSYRPISIELIELITQGSIGEAIELTTRIFPKIFETSREIVFRLKCQQLIELIRMGLSKHRLIESQQYYQEILGFGLDLQNEFTSVRSENTGFRNRLKEVFSLLAYRNPYESPIKYLLDDEERKSIAYALNDTIISIYFGHKLPNSSLDRIMLHIQLVLKELGTTAGDPSSALISFESDLLSIVER